MQYRASPFHRQADRDAYVSRGARISDFIRKAQAGRDILQLQLKQLPLGLPTAPFQLPQVQLTPTRAHFNVDFPERTEAVPSGPSGLHTYDPAPLANTLITQALAAIEQLGRLMIANEEREKQLRLYDDPEASPARPPLDGSTRSAVDECLASASALLNVTRALHNRLPAPTPQQCVEESRELTELSKAAGRAAYRAALLIVDPEFKRVPRAASHSLGKVRL